MTHAAAPALVSAPQLTPPLYGLLSALSFPTSTTDRWESGVEWETLSLGLLGTIGQWDDTGTPGIPKTLGEGRGPMAEASPFTVYGEFACTPVGWTPEQAQDAASTRLLMMEEASVEAAIWGGGTTEYTSPVLSDASIAHSGALDAVDGVGALEYAFGRRMGTRPVLHMSRRLALILLKMGALEARGTALQTKLGSPAVAGSGYPDVSTIVATPPMVAYRSEVFTSSSVSGDLLDRGQNILHAVAERSYLVGWDASKALRLDVTVDGSALTPLDAI